MAEAVAEAVAEVAVYGRVPNVAEAAAAAHVEAEAVAEVAVYGTVPKAAAAADVAGHRRGLNVAQAVAMAEVAVFRRGRQHRVQWRKPKKPIAIDRGSWH